ncbi:ArnT family glycosyltransferase [Amaricoccus macauensis]|uniref:ArnT family glycosyltransferase n=1 Tax=Amaricoccus macauensis TaxID=57001 RepID=UPI003C7C7E5C
MRDWIWTAAFCGYFAFHAVYRWLIGGALGLDEAQMFLWSQYLAWGYGPQPPLYSWLQWLAFQLIADPLLALSLVKNLLLCMTFLCVYAVLRTAHSPVRAGLATAGLLLLPQIAWESQRALSHSVLATAMAALACLIFWTRTLPGKRLGYLSFGLVAGLGLLSKANFALVPPALVLAALSLPELRARIRFSGLMFSVFASALIAFLPVIWILRNREAALASTYKLRIDEETGGWITALEGIGATAEAAFLFLALPLIAGALIFWRFRVRSSPAVPPTLLDRFLLRTALIGVMLTLAVVLVTGTTQVKDRWMLPSLYLGGPLVALWFLPRVTAAGHRWYRRLVGTCIALVALILPIELRFGTPGNPVRGGTPVEALAPQLTETFPDATRVIGDPEWLAASLEYHHSPWQAEPAHSARLAAGETALLIWTEELERGAKIAARIADRSGNIVEIGEHAEISAPYVWQSEMSFTIYAAPLLARKSSKRSGPLAGHHIPPPVGGAPSAR